MTPHASAIRLQLSLAPQSGTQLAKKLGLSQPTVARALKSISKELIQSGDKKSSKYHLVDLSRGFESFPVFKINALGQIIEYGELTPVRPDGFVFKSIQGEKSFTEGIPWWLYDMRPQGFLGRAYAMRWGNQLGLPQSLKDWSDSHSVHAMLLNGHDSIGHWVLGANCKNQVLNAPDAHLIKESDKPKAYLKLTVEAMNGDAPGSSAGGEQPKFTAYSETEEGPSHVLVKFTELQDNPNSQRWRDLLLAEHLALQTLRVAGHQSAKSKIYDFKTQRFLEIERFDRQGALGRIGVVSLEALDAEFVGLASEPWPVIAKLLSKQKLITQQDAQQVGLLWAFGNLIGNCDMHNGNLSFLLKEGPPYSLAPCYDMTPMSFAPSSAGRLPQTIREVNLHNAISHSLWKEAMALSDRYFSLLKKHEFSKEFEPCLLSIQEHLHRMKNVIDRLA